MPGSLGAVAPRGGVGGGQGGGQVEKEDDGEAQPQSALANAVMGNLAEGPFSFVAFKTGHDHWLLAPEERALMSEAAGAIAAKHGLVLNPQTNPWGCLLIGYIGFGMPRLIEEIKLIRSELKRQNDAKEKVK